MVQPGVCLTVWRYGHLIDEARRDYLSVQREHYYHPQGCT